jgi:hypothetical protein
VPFSEFFSSIDIIPLETRDESLIKRTGKVMYVDGLYYLLDTDQFYLFVFDSTGRYVNRIAKVGQGPGEYTYIYDFLVNTRKERIEMLSPYRQILYYDYEGNFIEDIRFSDEVPFFSSMKHIDENDWVILSLSILAEKQTLINIVSSKTGKRIAGYWDDDYYNPGYGLSSYNDAVFFNHSEDNKVYQITPEHFKVVYEWKYDKPIIDSATYRKKIQGYAVNDALYRKFDTGEIPYCYLRQAQTDRYYYAQLFHNYKKVEHIFYDKQTGTSYYFEKIDGGIEFNVQSDIEDNYMLTLIEYADRKSYLQSSLLDEENRKKLLNLTEFDNPVLVKYTFKK